MRPRTVCLLLLFALASTLAYAQLPQFRHIVIIVQENRTPDNLFGSGPSLSHCGTEDPFEAGVDIVGGGYGTPPGGSRQEICSFPVAMNAGFDPDHFYDDINNNGYGWLHQYDSGNMDGFCEIYTNGQCLQYSYVQRPDVQPYFDIATNYGFANYMFQTNEGPSFPAHQMLFSGTSAPTNPNDPSGYGVDFVAENPINQNGGNHDGGCADDPAQRNIDDEPSWVFPTGVEFTATQMMNLHLPFGLECYPHDSLVTAVNGTGITNKATWHYYTPTDGSIWTAPAAIPEACYGQNSGYPLGNACRNYTEYSSHVIIPGTMSGQGAPIFGDIADCNLPQITWVIPDQAWSDHPGQPTGPAMGPSWVGDIIDAVGGSPCTDTVNGSQVSYWDDTAIFVVWDDWGGFYDHVSPATTTGIGVYRSTEQGTCPISIAPNGWGCGNVYGFRVPLLVVSAYTNPGYVSGMCTGTCPNSVFPYVHDFGSILAFTEYNFGMGSIDNTGDKGYADRNAPDNSLTNIPLQEFFSVANKRTFTYINTPYPSSTFTNYYQQHPNYQPTGPDGGPDD